MATSTEVRKRRVMQRDHADIARYISEELRRREGTDWRRKHEVRWREVDRQIAMEPPETIHRADELGEEHAWHNAIQLGDLTDASATLAADVLRLAMPVERKFFTPHVELPFELDQEGDPVPVDPERQRQVNGVLRNLMVQQHKDFGVRGRIKLAIKEILHHGSVVLIVDEERLLKFHKGAKPDHLKAPIPVVHSMWNCFPDPSPTIQGTEIYYKGSMLIREWVRLQDALEMPGWINKDKLRAEHAKKELQDHIEILYYYGDIFLKRHDGNILFPNRKTVVSNEVFLESTINKTPYSPVIYTGYERDDVRDSYYTSPIVKRAPMGKFASHMANKTMDSVDLKVQPPVAYDSLDNSFRANGPAIFPGAKIGNRGGINIKVLDVGDPEIGLAAMQFAKQEMKEGTTVDAVRKGVSPGTEQTATEVVKTEQRAEVRSVEFVANIEDELLLPYLTMQHDLNVQGMDTYPFFNDELHTPDFLRATRKDLPKAVVMEVTGSRALLGEEQRTARFINTVGTVAQLEPLATQTDWQEVNRQIWEDTRVKDPERFIKDSDRNAEVQAALEAQQQQFEELAQQLQQAVQQAQQQAQEAQDAQRKAETAVQKADLQREQGKLEAQQLQLQKATLQEQLRLAREMERAEDQLQALQQDIKERELKMRCAQSEAKVKGERDNKILSLAEKIASSDS